MSPIQNQKTVYLLIMVFVLLAGIFTPVMGAAETATGLLDEQTFFIEQGEKGKEANETDTLIFKDGRFRSTGCDQYGFGDAPYTATQEGNTIRFVADTFSEKSGTIHWEGTVEGKNIAVVQIWTDKPHWYKRNPKPLEKWGKGELQQPE